MATDNNSTAILDLEAARDDATVTAIRNAWKTPLEIGPENALVLARQRGVMRDSLAVFGTLPVVRGPGRPEKSKYSLNVVERLERQIKMDLPTLPEPAAVVRFRAGDQTRKIVAKVANKLAEEGVKSRSRATKIAQKTRISERQVRDVLRKNKKLLGN